MWPPSEKKRKEINNVFALRKDPNPWERSMCRFVLNSLSSSLCKSAHGHLTSRARGEMKCLRSGTLMNEFMSMTSVSFGHIHSRTINRHTFVCVNEWIYVNDLSEFSDIFTPIDTPGPSTDKDHQRFTNCAHNRVVIVCTQSKLVMFQGRVFFADRGDAADWHWLKCLKPIV